MILDTLTGSSCECIAAVVCSVVDATAVDCNDLPIIRPAMEHFAASAACLADHSADSSAVLPAHRCSMISAVEQINALNLDPAVPASEDKRNSLITGKKCPWIKTSDGKGGWKKVAAESLTDLRTEFKQPLDLFRDREAQKTQQRHQQEAEVPDAAIVAESFRRFTCFDRTPEVGDQVYKSSGPFLLSGKKWLYPGEIATVVDVNPNNGFRLRGPDGTLTHNFITHAIMRYQFAYAEEACKLKTDTAETSSSESLSTSTRKTSPSPDADKDDRVTLATCLRAHV